MVDDGIVATAICYFDQENVNDSTLAFRAAVCGAQTTLFHTSRPASQQSRVRTHSVSSHEGRFCVCVHGWQSPTTRKTIERALRRFSVSVTARPCPNRVASAQQRRAGHLHGRTLCSTRWAQHCIIVMELASEIGQCLTLEACLRSGRFCTVFFCFLAK